MNCIVIGLGKMGLGFDLKSREKDVISRTRSIMGKNQNNFSDGDSAIETIRICREIRGNR